MDNIEIKDCETCLFKLSGRNGDYDFCEIYKLPLEKLYSPMQKQKYCKLVSINLKHEGE